MLPHLTRDARPGSQSQGLDWGVDGENEEHADQAHREGGLKNCVHISVDQVALIIFGLVVNWEASSHSQERNYSGEKYSEDNVEFHASASGVEGVSHGE